MIVAMQPGATLREITAVIRELEARGVSPTISRDGDHTLVTAVDIGGRVDRVSLRAFSGVREIVEAAGALKRVSREFHPQDTIVEVLGAAFGDGSFPVIAGPCSIESEEQIHAAAAAVHAAGATVLRGGAYKPRTSPYAFQGLGEPGLRMMRDAARANGLACVSEVMGVRQVETAVRYLDLLQIGARNMQNYDLLREVGGCGKPVLLKRGPSSTIEELLLAAEYVLDSGNPRVILCERGIRTFETATRNTLDLAAVPVVKQRSHLPIIVDPSHAAGKRELVGPLAMAALAAGADGLIVEVHPDPAKALSDGRQSLTFTQFDELAAKLRRLAAHLNPQSEPARPALMATAER